MRVRRFATVGVMNTTIDFVLFSLLALGFGLHVAVANMVSYSTGILNSYLWNRNWTFSDRRSRAWGAESIKFALANLGGLAVNTSIVWLVTAGYHALEGAGVLAVSTTLVIPGAKVVALVGSVIFNYIAFNSWVFVGGEVGD